MDIKQLKYFIEVADTKNLSRAAENLYISQPTLSLAMKKIEKDLNTKLFGKKQKYSLTPAGQLLYDRGSEIVRNFDRLISEMDDFGRGKNEVLRLGVTILFAVQYMHQISTFIAKHQNVNLHIIQDGSINLQKMLAKGEIDIAIASLPNLYPKDIKFTPLENKYNGYNVSVVMLDSNPLADKDEIELIELKDQKFSTLNEDYMIGELLMSRSRELGFTPDIVMEHVDLQVLLHSISELGSVCLLPIEYRGITDSPNLKWVPLKDDRAFFQVGIAERLNIARTEAANDLANNILNA